ncbi:PREDICTED: sodium- and chloride-dependent glycine transporter 2-like [Priapulus caudatus]|uniref:Sodium- and chloride-dependent glycine transporter 2-like n=1 Tax=Priapulus caudatus TaxID=37621 RepID=A0ABM1EDS8_PRICU|nr:PREDICTED: sodium- and chloride-dependent glycine transporter 2-like [Priapulus caudatus]
MPVAPLWSICFFFMMIILGFGSQFSIMETVMSAVIDSYPHILRTSTLRTVAFRATFCSLCFLLGLTMVTRGGMYVLNIMDESVGGITLVIVGIVEFVALHWVYGTDRVCDDIYLMIGVQLSVFWRIAWKYVSPITLIIVIIMSLIQYSPVTYEMPYAENGVYIYPKWSMIIEWSIVGIPVFVIIAAFLHEFCSVSGWTALKEAAQPGWNWGPAADQRNLHSGDSAKQIFRNTSEISLSSLDPTNLALSIDMNNGITNNSFDPTLDNITRY